MFIESQIKDLEEINKKVNKIEKNMQSSVNARLDKMIFSYVESETKFNNEKPHKENLISIVQVSSNEINMYKGDKRIMLGGARLNHAIIVPVETRDI